MHRITLVWSGHRENGLCNAEELLKILRAIGPEVIFEESRPSDRSLENQAIAKYRESRSFQRVPVDRYEMPDHVLADIRRVFGCVIDCVEQTSHEYLVLTEEHDDLVRRYGFKYLNSDVYETTRTRLAEIEEKTIIGTHNQSLIRGLEWWRRVIRIRELGMIENIYDFCRESVFDTGVFLVGAAHRTGIISEIENRASIETVRINWILAYDGADPLGAI